MKKGTDESVPYKGIDEDIVGKAFMPSANVNIPIYGQMLQLSINSSSRLRNLVLLPESAIPGTEAVACLKEAQRDRNRVSSMRPQ